MNPGKALDQLLTEALALPAGAERDSWIEDTCDPALEAELRELIAAHESAGSFLGEPLVDAPTMAMSTGGGEATRNAEGPGTVIGHYTLVELLGEGGFGAVYRADQAEPVRRAVALKILKLGLDT
jgi:hypothetical protein